MCRSGTESAGTGRRRCTCTPTQQEAHNATRSMTRIAAELRVSDDEERAEALRDRFLTHCARLREARGMGDGEYPSVPPEVSDIGRYDRDTLNALPYEVLEEQSMKTMESGDYPATEALCAELDRRNEIAREWPEDMEYEEQDRWDRLRQEGLPETLDHLDPITHPMARESGNSPADRERRMRVEYEAYLEQQILRAEEATNGNILSPKGFSKALRNPNITTRAMWTNHVMATHYASEELRRFWSEPGNERLSFAAFCESWTGRGDGTARERVRTSSLLAF